METTRQGDTTRHDNATTTVGQLVSLPEAARVLGLSLAAVRKRRERGLLRGMRREGRWYVWLSEGDKDDISRDNQRDSGHDMRHDMSSPVSAELDKHLEAENTWLRSQLESRDRQIAELHVLLQRALEQRAPLVLTAAASTTAPVAKPRPSWWRRFLYGPATS